ncbi:type III-B CRISPR module-associated Cmr3 family protein [Roseiflexus sp.]|uniref:type III-B CRISPR module-associated Cmr3 family protein n=1 Tax=Roseiflexus sp. TaxID=2562120 RepID=UPI00398AD313
MLQLGFDIEALAPLTFPERKPGAQFNASLPYVPGAAIFGALGQVIGAQTFDDALFRAIRCHNAYPAQQGDAWVRPLPATAIQPKGADGTEEVTDSLYARVCWERQQPSALIYAPTDADGRPWEAVGQRFYTLSDGGLQYRSVQQRILTRVAINRQRGTAENQRLYSLLAISETTEVKTRRVPTRFRGSMALPPSAEEQVRSALTHITHLGGRQTSGLGAVRVHMTEIAVSVDETQQVQQRVAAMTQRFREQARLYEELGGMPWSIEGNIFTINLLADAILLEQGWLPTQELSAEQFKDLTGIEATLLRAFTTTKIVGGWHTLWQRPKPTSVAVAMGGLYVFQTDRPLTEEDYRRLAQLQIDGIGERRTEGYGQIRICDEFHLR